VLLEPAPCASLPARRPAGERGCHAAGLPPEVAPLRVPRLSDLPQFQGAHRERTFWGTYRPGLYLGAHTPSPAASERSLSCAWDASRMRSGWEGWGSALLS